MTNRVKEKRNVALEVFVLLLFPLIQLIIVVDVIDITFSANRRPEIIIYSASLSNRNLYVKTYKYGFMDLSQEIIISVTKGRKKQKGDIVLNLDKIIFFLEEDKFIFYTNNEQLMSIIYDGEKLLLRPYTASLSKDEFMSLKNTIYVFHPEKNVTCSDVVKIISYGKTL